MEVYHKLVTTGLADHLSVIGFLISLVGFGVTWLKLKAVKKNNESLALAVNQAIDAVSRIDTLKELSAMVEQGRFLAERFVAGEPEELAKKIEILRERAVRVRHSQDLTSDNAVGTLNLVTSLLTSMHGKISGTVLQGESLPINKRRSFITSTHQCIEYLHLILVEIQSKIIQRK